MNNEQPKNNEVTVEALVAQLRDAGLENADSKMMIHQWIVSQGDRSRIDRMAEQARICEEAGLEDEAVEQLHNAIDYGQRNGDLERTDELSKEIRRLTPAAIARLEESLRKAEDQKDQGTANSIRGHIERLRLA